MSRKALLEHQIRLAFSDDGEMSLAASVKGCSDDILSKRISEDAWSIGEILDHVARCKIMYCKQGWGKWSGEVDDPPANLAGMMQMNVEANDHLLECLGSLDEADLDAPLQLPHHGSSAYHFFTVMIIHDVSHAAQIRATLRHCGERTGSI